MHYYLVVRNNKEKKALVVYVGRNVCDCITDKDIEEITTSLKRIDDTFESYIIEGLEDVKVTDIRIGHLSVLLTFYKELERIKNTNTATTDELTDIIPIYGLIVALTRPNCEMFEWGILTHDGLFNDEKCRFSIPSLKKEGFEIYIWN